MQIVIGFCDENMRAKYFTFNKFIIKKSISQKMYFFNKI